LLGYLDTNLLVPEHTDCQLPEEFGDIENWALKNKMIINNANTKELVFRIGFILLNLICLIHLMALLKNVLLSFLV